MIWTTGLARRLFWLAPPAIASFAWIPAENTFASDALDHFAPPRAMAGTEAGAGVEPVARVETVDVATIDRQGTIAIDGRIVAQGDYRGRIPVGAHVMSVTRPGYDPFESAFVLRAGQPYVQLVELTPSLVVGQAVAADESARGFYGGFLLHAMFEPGGLKGNLCSVPGVTDCSTSSPVGGGILGMFGYMVDSVGVDALFGLQVDAATATATAEGQTATVVIPRVGGVFAARARLAWQNSTVRLTAAAGVGASLRSIGLIAGGLDSATRLAPAITLASAAHLRVGKATAISLGLLFWGENAGQGETLQVRPLTTSVVVVRSTQVFLMPFIGMEIGP